MQATKFVFGPYRVDWESGTLEFDYSIEFSDAEPLQFTERIQLPLTPASAPEDHEVLKQILQNLSLVLGVSYYKTYIPSETELPFELTEKQAEFWNTVYRKGLGEFWYRNNLDIPLRVLSAASPPSGARRKAFRAADGGPPLPPPASKLEAGNQVLLGIGGGKESIVAAELLKKEGMSVTGFVVETERGSEIIDDVVETLQIPVLKIRRMLDPKLFGKLGESYNGHVPVSAIYAWLGVLLAAQHGLHWVAVGNEYSSDFGNLEYQGEIINHQWSKSSEFENLFQGYVRKYISEDITYFSLLRPFHEIRITKQLVNLPVWNSVKNKFSSCNRNFVHHGNPANTPRESPSATLAGESAGRWCGECPKCAFVFAMLAAFLPKDELVEIFGKNLLNDANLIPIYRDLLGWGDLKPFDCVGTFEETQAALWAAREKFAGDSVLQEFVSQIDGGEEAWKRVMKAGAAPTLPERFRFVGIEKVLILGYAREGKVSEKFLQKFYPDIEIGTADQRDGEGYLNTQATYDLAIKTPGIPRRLLKIPYTTATNIFFSRVPNLIISVTGSKGKSTTASLIFEILKAAGKSVELLGNIGKPMLEALLAGIDSETIFVLELSSQQLEDLRVSPPVAVVTTLFPEHMDYHGSVEAYYAAKKNIIRYQTKGGVFVFDPNNKTLAGWAAGAPGQAVPFAENLPLSENEIPLLGKHNQRNVAAAVAVVRLFNVADDSVAQAIRQFKPLPHRLELVGEFRGIRFYDNASSTTPESTIAALQTIPGVQTIFLGGLNRGYDFAELAQAVAQAGVATTVLFPDSGKDIKHLLPASVETLETSSMEEAVRFAYAKTVAGKAVLLSAASPSYSLWTNFSEQGDEFQKWVKTLA